MRAGCEAFWFGRKQLEILVFKLIARRTLSVDSLIGARENVHRWKRKKGGMCITIDFPMSSKVAVRSVEECSSMYLEDEVIILLQES